MYVVVGFFAACLLALAVIPAVWRRAVRLTRAAMMATNPSTYAEVRAAQDLERAEHAMAFRRVEREAEILRDRVNELRIALSRSQLTERTLKAENIALSADFGLSSAREATLREEISHLKKDLHKTIKANSATNARQSIRLAKILKLSTGKEAEAAQQPQVLATQTANPASDQIVWEDSEATAALATITGLEAQIATLQHRLAMAEQGNPTEITPETDHEGLRPLVGELEGQLIDMETRYITAQAEIARLSHLVPAENGPEPLNALAARLKSVEAERAHLTAVARDRDRALDRARAQLARLRKEMRQTPEIHALRSDLNRLCAEISGATSLDAPSSASSSRERVQGPAAALVSRIVRAGRNSQNDGIATQTEQASSHPSAYPVDAVAEEHVQGEHAGDLHRPSDKKTKVSA